MSENAPRIATRRLNGYAMRTARIDDTEFVAVEDFCGYVQGLVGKIAELSRRQQEQMNAMGATLDAVCEVLGEQDPDLRREVLAAAQRTARLV